MFGIVSYVFVPIVMFIVFFIIYYLGVFNSLMFPNPLVVLKNVFILLFELSFYVDFSVTFYRVVLAILLSVIVGVPIGLFIGYSKKVYLALEFIIDFFRSIPVSALFPIFMLLFGIGDMSKIFSSAWATTLIIIVNTSYGVKHATKSYLKMARVYRVGGWFRFVHIILPQALPHILSGVRIGLSISLIIVIIFEMFAGAVNGLGYAIMDAQLAYRIPEMYALILLIGVFGYLFNKVLLLFEKRTVHWIV